MEALNNSLKHSSATEVTVSLESEGAGIFLEAPDNGKGFNLTEAAASGGLGMVNMRERPQRVGGSIDILSAPGRGTVIRLAVGLAEVPAPFVSARSEQLAAGRAS